MKRVQCSCSKLKTQGYWHVLTKNLRTRLLRSSKHQKSKKIWWFALAANQFSLTFGTCQELTYTVFINPLVLCLSVAGPGRVSRLPGLGPPLVRILFGRNPFATRAVPRKATCPDNLVIVRQPLGEVGPNVLNHGSPWFVLACEKSGRRYWICVQWLASEPFQGTVAVILQIGLDWIMSFQVPPVTQ